MYDHASADHDTSTLWLRLPEGELWRLQSLFIALFAQSGRCIAIHDERGAVVYASPALLDALGLTPDQLNNLSAVDPGYFAKVQAALGNSIPLGLPSAESPLSSRLRISPIILNGNLKGVISADWQNSVQDEIVMREHYQRALLNNFPYMVWLKDRQDRFMATNDAFARNMGLASAQEIVGKTDFDFFPTDMARGYVEDDLEVLQSGMPKTVVEMIRRQNGELYWAETYKSPVKIDGEVVGTVGFARDISEQRALEAEIHRRHHAYVTLVENLPLAIARYNMEGKRIFSNASFDTAFGPQMEADSRSKQQGWNADVANMTADDFRQHIQYVLKQGEAQTHELHVKSTEAESVYQLKLVPERNAEGVVIGVLALANDITETSRYREKIEHLAFHDALTGLPNRMLFNERIKFAIEHANRYSNSFGVLFLDLDNFKSINDTLGHHIGDELLVETSERIRKLMRSYDTVARLGGDEFALLVIDIHHLHDLALFARKIVQALAEPFEIAGLKLFISASIGISSYPNDSDHINDLLKYADLAMYHAKRRGRNNYQFYAQELTENTSEHLLVENLLRQAIARNELQLYFQPIVSVSTGEMTGVEALLRWHSFDLGFVGPDKFIPIAEERGLIADIGAWVMRTACATVASWNRHRKQPYIMAINLSSRQFMQENFLQTVAECMDETGCQPEWLKLEITESLLLQDSEEIRQKLLALTTLGFSIAIDDFGTGYSSLGYLNKFPVSQVKIDRSFICNITVDPDHVQLVKAIIAMAKSLRKDLVAEGVETQEQAELLAELGCEYVQGFYYGRPMPLEQLHALLKL